MSKNQGVAEPNLAKPGGGLPFFEWAIANYILIPRLLKNTDREKALAHFAKESQKIIALSSKLAAPKLAERRLIPRLQGLEDSSRYYSVAMTLQHLIIVGNSIAGLVQSLSAGQTSSNTKGTADFKPDSDINPDNIVFLFEKMSEQFLEKTAAADIDAFPQVTYPHPWFGPLNARKWLIFAAPHQKIHRHQIESIIARL